MPGYAFGYNSAYKTDSKSQQICGNEIRSTLIILCVTFFGSGAVVAQDPEPSLEDLIAVVDGKDSIKSAAAIREIGKRKPTSDLAIQTLVSSLTDDRPAVFIPDQLHVPFPVPTVGSSAADALGEIGKPAVSRICEFLEENDDTDVRRRAIRSLSHMEGEAADALPLLQRLLGDAEMEIRLEAVAAVISIQKDPRSLASVLKAVLSDESPDVRAAAIREVSVEQAPACLPKCC
ncbi:MAG: HEAT repeat domain-containing protein [Planctomycetaceae bacterium]